MYSVRKFIILYFFLIFFERFAFDQVRDSIRSEELSYVGFEFYQIRDYEKAKYYFQSAIDVNSENWLAYTMLAFSYLDAGNFEETLELVDKYLKLFEENNLHKTEEYLDLLKCKNIALDFTGNYEQSIVVLTKLIDLGDEHYKIYHHRARAYVETGLFTEALRDIKISIDLKPDDGENYLVLAKINYILGDFEESILNCKKSLTLSHEDPTIYFTLGRSNFELLKINDAIENFDLFLRHPNSQLTPDRVIEAKYKIGILYAQLRKWESVILHLEPILPTQKSCSDCYYALALSYLETEQYDKLIHILKTAIQFFSNESGFRLIQAEFFILQGLIDMAEGELKTALKLGPSDMISPLNFYVSIVRLAGEINKLALALDVIDRARAEFPDNPMFIELRLAVYLTDLQHFSSDAINDLNSLISLTKGNGTKKAYFHAIRSKVYFVKKEYDKSLNDINKALRLDPFPEYLVMRSIINLKISTEFNSAKRSDQKSVLKDINLAIESNYRKVDMLRIKMIMLLVFGRNSEACEISKELIDLGLHITDDYLEIICLNQDSRRNFEVIDAWGIEFLITPYEQRFEH